MTPLDEALNNRLQRDKSADAFDVPVVECLCQKRTEALRRKERRVRCCDERVERREAAHGEAGDGSLALPDYRYKNG